MAKVHFPIEAGHIMTFARALGDPNPVYHDREHAAPTFTIASAQFDPDYGARPRIGEAWKGSGRNPTGTPDAVMAGGTGLYAEQHFEYHAPIHPGDALSSEAGPGRTWEKPGRRGGKLEFQESVTQWRNQRGELVVTSRKVVVYTSQTVSQS
jgi:acyl dehydratase